MPTLPKKANAVTAENTAKVLNAIANDQGLNAPTVHAEGEQVDGRAVTARDASASLRDFGTFIMSFQSRQNAFLDGLVNRIGQVLITSRLYENPLRFFKKGILEYGETIEEIFVEMARPYQYNPEKDAETVFKRYPPAIKSAFHHLNFRKYYPTSVNEAMLRQAFLSWEGVSDLTTRVIEQVYTGANYDEFITFKYLLGRHALNGNLYSVGIPEVTADNARSVTSTMVKYAKDLTFMRKDFNFAGVTTYTDPSKLYMLITTELSSIFDVEVLAMSFNMTKAELIGRQVSIDDFGLMDNERLAYLMEDDPDNNFVPFTDAEVAELKTIKGVMLDESFFVILDALIDMTNVYNPKTLEWTYFYHIWKVISASPFANCIIFTTTAPSVTAVAVTPDTASVAPGGKVQFTATVTSDGFADKSVHWEVSGDGTRTKIDQNGLLTVGAGETETTFTVKATSKYNPDASASATVTVTGA